MKRGKQASRLANVISLDPRASPLPSARLGWVTDFAPDGSLLVDYEGNRRGSLVAVSMVKLSAVELQAAAERRQPVVLVFDDGDPLRPIVLGFIHTPDSGETLAEERLPSLPEVALVDGKRVYIEGKDEIVLRCGEASITLRRNGKVIIRGTYLDSHSSGTNRVKGASVRIN